MGDSTAKAALPEGSSRREARRQAFMEAATASFREKGYGATSLNDVVRVAGGSLATLYELFGNKAGLLRAIITERCTEITGMFAEADLDQRDPQEALTVFGRRLFDLLMSEDARTIIRLIIAEGSQFPELAPMFFSSGPDKGRDRVADYLARQTQRGALRVPDPQLAAEQFCELVRGMHHLHAICGIPVELNEAERERHIAGAVSAFMRAYGP